MSTKDIVWKALDLSTAHVPSSNCEDFGDLRYVAHELGWVVWLPSGPVRDTPDWIKPIIRRARDSGCQMLNFDRDARMIDGLPVYDW